MAYSPMGPPRAPVSGIPSTGSQPAPNPVLQRIQEFLAARGLHNRMPGGLMSPQPHQSFGDPLRAVGGLGVPQAGIGGPVFNEGVPAHNLPPDPVPPQHQHRVDVIVPPNISDPRATGSLIPPNGLPTTFEGIPTGPNGTYEPFSRAGQGLAGGGMASGGRASQGLFNSRHADHLNGHRSLHDRLLRALAGLS